MSLLHHYENRGAISLFDIAGRPNADGWTPLLDKAGPALVSSLIWINPPRPTSSRHELGVACEPKRPRLKRPRLNGFASVNWVAQIQIGTVCRPDEAPVSRMGPSCCSNRDIPWLGDRGNRIGVNLDEAAFWPRRLSAFRKLSSAFGIARRSRDPAPNALRSTAAMTPVQLGGLLLFIPGHLVFLLCL
jgi:hypothetical protein